MRTTTLAAAVAPILLALPLLAACSEDEPADPTAPVEVELGKEFTWNDFTVADGWSLETMNPSAGVESVEMPVIAAEATNGADEPRFVLFEVVFAKEGNRLATIHCTSVSIEPGATEPLDCTGFGQEVPQGQDTIVVQEITR
ncbi:hypothetical protein [Nocardioides gansuensis]|nr:hypothetical protein [Nocardioides gansuensis]